MGQPTDLKFCVMCKRPAGYASFAVSMIMYFCETCVEPGTEWLRRNAVGEVQGPLALNLPQRALSDEE